MKRKRESDASLVLGLILGIVVGAAAAIILTEDPEQSRNFPIFNRRIEGRLEQAGRSLQENDKDRVEGAAEAAS